MHREPTSDRRPTEEAACSPLPGCSRTDVRPVPEMLEQVVDRELAERRRAVEPIGAGQVEQGGYGAAAWCREDVDLRVHLSSSWESIFDVRDPCGSSPGYGPWLRPFLSNVAFPPGNFAQGVGWTTVTVGCPPARLGLGR